MFKNIKTIGFDADDTLWVNETFYRENEQEFYALLKNFMPANELEKILFQTEMNNLEIYGYGIKAFVLSMIETALKISDNKISIETIQKIIEIGREQLNKPVELLDGVENVLNKLHQKYKIILATKGDLLDQERKLKKSGLSQYFSFAEIMSDKKEENYYKLINQLKINPSEFVMVGNSLKSDVLPVVGIGGFGIHIPYHTTWLHEQVESHTYDTSKYITISHFGEILQKL